MARVQDVLADRLYLSAVGIVVVLAMATAYIFAVVLDQPLTSRPVTVEVELEQTGGLFEGSAVTYRGVKVGKVTRIVPAAGGRGVLATVSISSGADIPADSLARVRSLSPVGEQYLDFQPQTMDGPYLASGDLVGAESTDIPESLSSTVVAVNDVLRQIDDRKLRIVLHELSTGLKGTGDDIGRVLDQGTQVLQTLEDVWPETDRVIRNSATVLDIGTDNAGSLRTLGTRAREFAAFLRDYRGNFVDVLDRTPGQLEDLEALIRDANEVLPGYLSVGVSFVDVVMSYEPHLRAILQEYADGLGALVGVLDTGQLRIELIPSRTNRCSYGSTRDQAWSTDQGAFDTDGRCSASFATLQRGAAHAPGPTR